MKYQSTRNKSICVDSAWAIKNGISPEGGLYVPTEIPQVTINDIENYSRLSYKERASEILGLFLTDYTKEELDFIRSTGVDYLQGYYLGRPA